MVERVAVKINGPTRQTIADDPTGARRTELERLVRDDEKPGDTEEHGDEEVSPGA